MQSHALKTIEREGDLPEALEFFTSGGPSNATGLPPLQPRALLPIFLIIAADTMGLGILLPLLPFYTVRTGASAVAVGALISTYAFSSFLAAPILGQLSDRYGRKPILILSQVGSLFGYVLFALSNSLWLLFVARTIDGLSAGNMSVAQAYVSDKTSASDRTRAFGITGAAFGLGLLLGPAVGGLLAVRNLRAPLWVAAGLSAVSIVCTAVLLPKGTSTVVAGKKQSILPMRAMLQTFRVPETGRLAWLMTCFYFAFGTYMSGQALFLAGRFWWHGHRFGAENVGLVFTYGGLLNVLVQALLMKRLTKSFSEKSLLVAGFLLMAFGLVGIGVSSGIAVLICFLTVSNIGSAALRPVILSQLSKRVSASQQGLVMGVNQAIFSTTAILSPLLSGTLISRGLYTTWAWTAAAVVFVGSFIAYTLKPQTTVAL
jgi:multidrug resistance protein